ncbi:MAG: 50S ribosomal protein L18e [Thermoplasmata archaeon]|jgi:large subunit ribosomal protein L18e
MGQTVHKQNPVLLHTLHELRVAARSHHAPIWDSVADRLERARHQTTPVNVGHLDRLVDADSTVVVPGKLLADGSLSKPVTVAAFAFSAEAREKIHSAGGKALTISDLVKAHPKGQGVRIFA